MPATLTSQALAQASRAVILPDVHCGPKSAPDIGCQHVEIVCVMTGLRLTSVIDQHVNAAVLGRDGFEGFCD